MTKTATATKISTKNTITLRDFRSLYCDNDLTVYDDHLNRLPFDENDEVRFQIIKPLPGLKELIKLQKQKFTMTVGEMIENSFGLFYDVAEHLSDAMQEACDEEDSDSERETIRADYHEFIDILEGLEEPRVDEKTAHLKVCFVANHYEDIDNALGQLEAVVKVLQKDNAKTHKALISELLSMVEEAAPISYDRYKKM
jgi:hypothetical protein